MGGGGQRAAASVHTRPQSTGMYARAVSLVACVLLRVRRVALEGRRWLLTGKAGPVTVRRARSVL
jgi:hypothetical protein